MIVDNDLLLSDSLPEGQDPRAESRVDHIFEILGDEIVSGAIRPGEKLPEEQLARRFGTSRAPLREALRRLEERRLVTRIPNVGVRVRSFTPGDFCELYQVRSVLEGLAARLAAERGERGALTSLRRDYQAHLAAVESGNEHPRQRDLDFHHSLALASGNQMLIALLCRDFYSFFAICRRQFVRVPGRDQRAVVEHRRVLEAIEDGDGELAELQMRRHVLNAKRNFEVAMAVRAGAGAVRVEPVPEES
jgi:DNA-binding GntR family transcriptional regulator